MSGKNISFYNEVCTKCIAVMESGGDVPKIVTSRFEALPPLTARMLGEKAAQDKQLQCVQRMAQVLTTDKSLKEKVKAPNLFVWIEMV